MKEFKIDPREFIDNAKVEYQYLDNPPTQWSVSVPFTEAKLEKIYNDVSISKVRITPFDQRAVFILDVV